jgi:Predicted nucleotide-binding protein containing TIR-like domain
MAMAPQTVFYAWQAQLPGTCNRSLIEEALERALRDLAHDQGGPIAFALDQDARGVQGSPEISATILQKIENCSIFVADITPVGSLINGKPTPNPNVLFELGYAWHKLGESHVILVLNQAFGSPEDLPFDISKRSLVQYRRDPNAADGPAKVRLDLTRAFRAHIAMMARDNHLRPLREMGLTEPDIKLFKAVYEKMLETDTDFCDYQAVLQEGNNFHLEVEEVIAGTQIGSDLGLWKATQVTSPYRYSHVEASMPGMEQFCRAFMPDYPLLTTEVQRQILEGVRSRGEISRSELASAVGKPEMVIGHILRQLQKLL